MTRKALRQAETGKAPKAALGGDSPDSPAPRSRKGSGVYQTGKERLLQIREAALEILIEDGYAALSLREVARRCNVHVGAISYYYKSRSDLFQDTINLVLENYSKPFFAIMRDASRAPRDKLQAIIELLLDDMQSKQTTRLFPHLWVLANHDEFAARTVESIYVLERVSINNLIAKINPGLGVRERETLAVFISASVAGSTMFVGHDKPWSSELSLYKAIASRSLVETVANITAEQLTAYGLPDVPTPEGWKPPTSLTPEEFDALLGRSRTDNLRGEPISANNDTADRDDGRLTVAKGRNG
jgi:AcrR family transcriptional regulator